MFGGLFRKYDDLRAAPLPRGFGLILAALFLPVGLSLAADAGIVARGRGAHPLAAAGVEDDHREMAPGIESPFDRLPALVDHTAFPPPPVSSLQVAAHFHLEFYRVVLSPVLGRRCHFETSCSRYAGEAIRTHGFIKGSIMAIDRFTRCHGYVPLDPHYPRDGDGRYLDPVPARPVPDEPVPAGEPVQEE